MVIATMQASAADVPAANAIPQNGPIATGLRVFTCGHSFHATFIPALVDKIATSAGINGHTIVGVSILGGSRAIQHFQIPDEQNKAKAVLTTGNVDVLTLSCMERPDDGIEKFAKLGFVHNPNIRVTLQELWLPQDQWPFNYHNRINQTPEDFNKTTIADLKKVHEAYFKVMEDYVTALNKSLGKQVVFIVPDAEATIALREKIIDGTAPDLQKQSDLFGDWWGHPKAPLMLLSAYCHYAVIYRRSPVGLSIPPGFSLKSQALNRLLQELAWDAVIHHPLSGVKSN